jgi:hypothetical protein
MSIQWNTARTLALLANGNELIDSASGYYTLQNKDGNVYWSAYQQSFRNLMANSYVQRTSVSVHGLASEVVYEISEKGRQAIIPVDWQKALDRPVTLRPMPGSSKTMTTAIGEIRHWWMDSPHGDNNTYLYVETDHYRGIALKKDNAALYHNGLFPDTSTNDFGKRKICNPYAFLAGQVVTQTRKAD